MKDLLEHWERLQKALDHKRAIQPATLPEIKDDEPAEPHPDYADKVQYGHARVKHAAGEKVPGAEESKNIGILKHKGKEYVVRHGASAHRGAVETELSKLLGADHMLAQSTYDGGVNHPEHHNKEDYDPHHHGGTSFQEYVGGDHPSDAADDEKKVKAMREQWKNGDLHKLWALHYVTNNLDQHPGNFKVTDSGVKAYDADQAHYELPFAHTVLRDDAGENMKYTPNMAKELPGYLAPFIHGDKDFKIPNKYKDDQVAVKQLNKDAEMINPQAFEQFGPHIAERARKAKSALASTNPTQALLKLWAKHSDMTKEIRARKPMEEEVA